MSLDNKVYEAARQIAFESRRTPGEVINELLLAGLKSRNSLGPQRELGRLRGSIWIAEDFDETPQEVIDDFESGLDPM